MTLTQKTNHVIEAQQLLLTQFRNLPNWNALLASYINQVQELEDMFFQILNDTTLDNSVGTQLDNFGTLLNVKREGLTDVEYRARLKGEIAKNQSSGTPEDVLAVVAAIVDEAVSTKYTPYYPAAFRIETFGAVNSTEGRQAAALVAKARLAGVDAQFVTSAFPESQVFRFSADYNNPEPASPNGFDNGVWKDFYDA